jgi:polysaccharide export outer membrane protein
MLPKSNFRLRMGAVVMALWLCVAALSEASEPSAAVSPGQVPAPVMAFPADNPLLKMGPGDTLSLVVHGQPDLSATLYVADDGTITAPMVGAVPVAGLSPAGASQLVAEALRRDKILVNPQVTIVLEQFRSQRVSVLGEVRQPGRFAIESRTSLLDLLAEAGGMTEQAADMVVLLRPNGTRDPDRLTIDLQGLANKERSTPDTSLRGGDTVFVPQADQFYIYGEVNTANRYRLEQGMTVMQAIARGGGLTPSGSTGRVRIQRRDGSGELVSRNVDLADRIQPNDVIFVRKRLF